MSRAKTNAPGEAPSAVATVVLIACMAVDSASSISSVAFSTSVGGVVCKSVLKMLPTVWCILSHIALDCGLRLVVALGMLLDVLLSIDILEGSGQELLLSFLEC
eukprot:scaffold386_cov105-Alexandrium_tamarense.AAC.3